MTGTREVLRQQRYQLAAGRIGRRVRWANEEWSGQITNFRVVHGHVYYVIEWDPGTPDWWSHLIPASTRSLIVEKP